MNFLGGLLFIYLACLLLFPKSCGKEAREVYDKFMNGWNKTIDKR